MLEPTTTASAIAAIPKLLEGIFTVSKPALTSIKTEFSARFSDCLKKYLENTLSRFLIIKTIVRGQTTANFYDVYHHLNIYNQNSKVLLTKNSDTFFESTSYTCIVGDAGSGKTTLVKHLFIDCVLKRKNIPIFLELRDLNEETDTFQNFISKKILLESSSTDEKLLKKMLDLGRFCFFLDGYDELNGNRKKAITKQINDFVISNKYNKFLITTRPYSDASNLEKFNTYKISPITKEENGVSNFITKQLYDDSITSEKIISSIKKIKNTKNEIATSYLANPLLLSLYILTFQFYADIPTKKYIFYRRVINSLFSEHDSKSKVGYVREKISGLNTEKFEDFLRRFSFISYGESRFSWDIDYVQKVLSKLGTKIDLDCDISNLLYDLKTSLSLWTDDGGEFSFSHRSLQEYFVAWFVKDLSYEKNKKYYQNLKITDTKGSSRRERENLLSLLEEMDNKNFTEHYKIPVLINFEKSIEKFNPGNEVKSFLLFFMESFKFSNTNISKLSDVNIVVRNEVYDSVYFHYEYTQKIYNDLDKCILELLMSKLADLTICEADNPADQDYSFCSVNDNLNIIYQNLTQDLINKIKFLLKKMNDERKKATEFICKVDKADDAVLDFALE
jgi:energy-coupling factor transporter ATP-binding protein EcfA2